MMSKKLLVIVPYRDRKDHLQQFIPHIHTTLDKQNIKHTVAVIEQDGQELFNRGLLLNIGFREYAHNFDYVCFHDVDMMGSSIDYSYSDIPLCLLRHRGKFKNVYNEYFGGITLFPNQLFSAINGFSNDYWGWGCEDDDLRLRCIRSNILVSHRDGSCTDLELTTDHQNRLNNSHYSKNFAKLMNHKNLPSNDWIKSDGLSNCNSYYKIEKKIILQILFISILI